MDIGRITDENEIHPRLPIQDNVNGHKTPNLTADTSPGNVHILGTTFSYTKRYRLDCLSSSRIRAGESVNGLKAAYRHPE